jgi:uncharacterized phiE125 gp8 family phage protein
MFRDQIYGTGGYGSLGLTEASPPQSFVEPLTLIDVKTFLRLPARSPVDPNEDAELSSFITAAREQAEILQGRDLVTKQWDLHYDYWPSYYIPLRANLQSVDLFTLKQNTGVLITLVENTDYIVDNSKSPGIVTPPYNTEWTPFTPWPSSAMLIRFTAGISTASPFWLNEGQRVKNGMRMLINNWFTNKLPFEKGLDATREYPFGLTQSLRQGGIVFVG